eukprot:403352613
MKITGKKAELMFANLQNSTKPTRRIQINLEVTRKKILMQTNQNCKDIEKKQTQYENTLLYLDSMSNFSNDLTKTHNVALSIIETNHLKFSIAQTDLEDLVKQLEYSKLEHESQVQSIQNSFDQEKDAFQSNCSQDQQILQQIRQLELETQEIEKDYQFIDSQVNQMQIHYDKDCNIMVNLSQENDTLKQREQDFLRKLEDQKEKLQGQFENEVQLLKSFSDQEFMNHLMIETPFSIVAIRDLQSIEHLSISIVNNGYRSLNFNRLNMQIDFDKILGNDYTEQKLVDWKDSPDIDLLILSQLNPCFEFVLRPWNDTLSEARNLNNRKTLIHIFDTPLNQFLNFSNLLYKHLNSMQEVCKIFVQTRRETLCFDDFEQMHPYISDTLNFQTSDFLLVTFQFYLTDKESIEIHFVNYLSQDEGLYDYLLQQIQQHSAYQPGNTKKKYQLQQQKKAQNNSTSQFGQISHSNQNKHNQMSQNDQTTLHMLQQQNNLQAEIRFKEFLPIVELISNQQPITFVILNVQSQQTQGQQDVDMNQRNGMRQQAKSNNFSHLHSILKFIKQFTNIKVASSKGALKYYQHDNQQ